MPVELLRHGETTAGNVYCGSSDVPLSCKGWQQMRDATASYRHWTRIVTSPLIRCAAFAHALAEARGIPVVLDDRLREMNFGRWENKSALEIQQSEPALLAQFWQNPLEHAPPGGESLPAVQQRVLNAWHEHSQWRQAQLLITHGGPIRIILCMEHQHPLERLLELDAPLATLKSISPRQYSALDALN